MFLKIDGFKKRTVVTTARGDGKDPDIFDASDLWLELFQFRFQPECNVPYGRLYIKPEGP
jgi:hypothetical protein